MKLSSRKFWAGTVSFVTALLTAFNIDKLTSEQANSDSVRHRLAGGLYAGRGPCGRRAKGKVIYYVITFMSVLSTMFALYWNFRRMGDESKRSAVWQAMVDTRLETIVLDLKELKELERNNSSLIREVQTRLTQHDHDIEDLKAKLAKAFERIDELKKGA